MMVTKTARHTGRDIRGIYLNDHLAGSTLGTELARRMAASAQHLPASGNVLKQLAADITEDRAALLEIMATLGVQVRGYKVYAAWVGEKAGRLKPNGHLLSQGRSRARSVHLDHPRRTDLHHRSRPPPHRLAGQ